MNTDRILNNAEKLFIKYGASVSVHYLRTQRDAVQADVVVGVIDACIQHYCGML